LYNQPEFDLESLYLAKNKGGCPQMGVIPYLSAEALAQAGLIRDLHSLTKSRRCRIKVRHDGNDDDRFIERLFVDILRIIFQAVVSNARLV